MFLAEIVDDKALLPTMFSLVKISSCLMRALTAGVFGYFASSLGLQNVFVRPSSRPHRAARHFLHAARCRPATVSGCPARSTPLSLTPI